MARRLALIWLTLAALSAAPAAYAADPPNTAARAVLVANGQTGEILHAENEDRRLPHASLTKLMTALVVLDWARPAELVTVAQNASVVGESSIELEPGEKLPVRDLLAAALVQSANDAAYALAAHVGDGDIRAFVRLMNAKAQELGLEDTRFVRPDGLDVPGHYSSAADVFALARVAMQRPLIRRLVRREGGDIAGDRSLFSWNDLLGVYPGLFGVKTGHTDNADWCQVAVARQDGVTTFAVILGSPTRARRNADLVKLLDWGRDQYERTTVVRAEEAYASAAVPFQDERLRLVPEAGAAAVVRVGSPLSEEIRAPAMVELPIDRGEVLGEVVVREGTRVVARRPLVAAEEIEDAGLAEQAGWYAERTLDEAGGMLSGVFGAFL